MRRLVYTLACTALVLTLAPTICIADEITPEQVASDPQAPDAFLVASDSDLDGNAQAETPMNDVATENAEVQNNVNEATVVTTDMPADSSETPCVSDDPATPDLPSIEGPANEEEQVASPDELAASEDMAEDSIEPSSNDDRSEQASQTPTAPVVAATPAAKQNTPAKKVAKKANSKNEYLVNNAIYYISSALAKKGAFTVSVKNILGKSKTNVVIAKKAKQLSQYWRVISKGDGIYNFVNCAGGYYLAVSGTVKDKANVYVNKKGTIDWKLVKNSDGTFSLKPATGKKTYLSVSGGSAKKGANIRLWASLSNNAQKFTFTKNKRLTKAYAKGQTVAPGVVKLSVSGTNLRVDIAGASKKSNRNATTAVDANQTSQVFQLRYVGNGLYEFQNANSYKALAIYNNSKKAGAKVVQTKRKLGLNQLWTLKETEGGFQIISARSGLAIDVAGGKAAAGKGLQMAKATDAATQKFSLTETQLVPNGTYVFQSAMALPMVLCVKGSSKDEGANVELNRSSGVKGEKFKVKYLKNGIYRITNKSTKKAIEVTDASKKDGANVQMAAFANTDNQKWVIELGDNGLLLKSVKSGKYLNVNSGQAKSGANVDQRAASGKANQCWNLASPDWQFYTGASSSAMKLITKAESYEGWRYQWGGRDPSTSFDCAGLVMYCSNKAWGTHFDLMNTNAEMLYEKCTHISAANAKPGDLVFYRGTYGNDVTYISHVVIYAGNGYMYGAGDPIGYAKVNSVKNIYGKKATAVYARIKH